MPEAGKLKTELEACEARSLEKWLHVAQISAKCSESENDTFKTKFKEEFGQQVLGFASLVVSEKDTLQQQFELQLEKRVYATRLRKIWY